MSTQRRPRWPLAAGAVVFLLASMALFAHVVAKGPQAATCTCSDVSQFTWYFAWVAHAIAHFQNPFYSTAMFHPRGVNLLANTSATGIAIPFAPLTWLFGPLTSLNVALILAPVASASALQICARRFVRSEVAALGAGLIYGFSPLVLFHEALGHLNVTFLAVPPLVLLCVHELFVLRQHRPWRVGLALGLLLTWQFFLGTEVLAMTVVVGAVVGVACLTYVALFDRAALAAWGSGPWRGLATAGSTVVLLLALPAAFALRGPAHLAGVIWPGVTLSNPTVRSFFTATGGTSLWWDRAGGVFLSDTYVAPTLVLVVLVGVVCWRKDCVLRTFAVGAALAGWFALGQRYAFAPWRYLHHLPLLENVVNSRFTIFVSLFGALAVAVTADRLGAWVPQKFAVAVASLAVVVALAPVAVEASKVAPYRATTLWVPQWYRVHASTLPAGSVVLGFPFFDTSANLLGVAAHFNDRYSVVGGTGPGWIFSRQGHSEAGYRVIWDLASTKFRPVFPEAPTAQQRRAVTAALASWGVTEVVVPISRGPNTSRVARDPRTVATWFMFLFGDVPPITDGAWVWHLDGRGHLARSD